MRRNGIAQLFPSCCSQGQELLHELLFQGQESSHEFRCLFVVVREDHLILFAVLICLEGRRICLLSRMALWLLMLRIPGQGCRTMLAKGLLHRQINCSLASSFDSPNSASEA